jgi:deoxyribose-phosphate aldolase
MSTLEELIAQSVERVHANIDLLHAPTAIARPPADLSRYFDHTLLKPDAVSEQIRVLCRDAIAWDFASVCVNGTWVPLCAELLSGSTVNVCAVAGFPLGATLPSVKAFEARELCALGAVEVDMVINVGKLKDGDYRLVYEDVAGVADECHQAGALVKVIFETSMLTTEEKVAACVICKEAGADFVKTSTGFGGGGATVPDIRLMRFVVGSDMGIKASGGVRSAADAVAMISAGATRIGSSSGVAIMQEAQGVAAGVAAPDRY